jgi:hypothetical protein
MLIASLVLIVLPVLFLAIWVPPINNDSMSGYLVRIEQWIQHRHVDFFPTSYPAQLFVTPLNHYLVLQLRLLSGGDYFSALVQFMSMAGSVVLVSLLAKEFGMRQKGQVLAAIIALTLPIGILQASSTQFDFTASFFFLAFVYWGHRSVRSCSIENILPAAFSLAAGLITKAYLAFYAAPFLLWFGLIWLFRYYKKLAMVVPLFLGLFLLFNTPHYYRNYRLTGHLVGDKELAMQVSKQHITLRNTLTNLAKHAGQHLGLPLPSYNRLVKKGVNSFHRALGVRVDDPASTAAMEGPDSYTVPFSLSEDNAGNFLHFLLFLACLVVFVLLFRRMGNARRDWLYWVLSILGGFLILSAAYRYLNSTSRYHMPLFFLMAVFTAGMLDRLFRNRSKVLNLMMALFILCALPFVFFNKIKPIIPLEDAVRNYLKNIPRSVLVRDMERPLQAMSAEEREVFYAAYPPGRISADSVFYLRDPALDKGGKQKAYGLLKRYAILEQGKSIYKARERLRFNNRYIRYEDYRELTRFIREKGYKDIGLALGNHYFEYPLWVMLRVNKNHLRMEHMYYPSYPYMARAPGYNAVFVPEVIITDYTGPGEAARIMGEGRKFSIMRFRDTDLILPGRE